VSWPPPVRRRQRRRRRDTDDDDNALVVRFNTDDDDDADKADEGEETVEWEFELNEKWAKRFARTELKRLERRKERMRETRERQPVSGRVERARAKAEETMRKWEKEEKSTT
jgi:hypothetical protein